MAFQEVIEVSLRIVQVQLLLVHVLQVFKHTIINAFSASFGRRGSCFELAPRRGAIVLESVIAIEVFDAIVIIALVRVANFIFDVSFISGWFLAHFRRLQFLTRGNHGRLS